MPMGRPKTPLVLTPEEKTQLRAVGASRSLPHGLVLRAKIILLSASGMSNQAIAVRLDRNPVTVGYWRRFLRQGLRGLHDELRPGRPRSLSEEQVARLIRKTLRTGLRSVPRGVVVRWLRKPGSRRTPSRASGGPSVCNRTGNVTFNCRTIHFLLKR